MEKEEFDKLFFKYNEALQILKDKFNNFYKEFENSIERKPIDHIKYRIKSKKSIKNKLKNKNILEFTSKNIEENLNDIAGIRIICPFLSDIDTIINYVKNDPDLTIIKVKNYIKTPKTNGYSSYHMIVSIPVLINGNIEQVKSEIQIRTMAMDVIASLDHKMSYKNDINISKEIEQKLQNIVNFVNLIDIELNKFINTNKITPIINNNYINIKFPYQKNELNNFLKKYKLALRKVEDGINSIKNDYIINDLISPIEHIESRIKPTTSIFSKLAEKNKNINLENIENHINDIGAIKVVCSFLSDANEIIEILNNQTDFLILDRQDYITKPKECGYSSYHFVVAVPIKLEEITTYVKIEIQVRTIIMDFWANIEHILCYKKEVNQDMKDQLKIIADHLRLIEYEMDELSQITIKKNNSINKPIIKKRTITKE